MSELVLSRAEVVEMWIRELPRHLQLDAIKWNSYLGEFVDSVGTCTVEKSSTSTTTTQNNKAND